MKNAKNKLFSTLIAIYFFACFFNLFTMNAHAYIDPSAVTYLIQAIAAVLIAIGACLTIFRHKIASFFKKGKNDTQKKEIHFEEENSDGGLESTQTDKED